MKKYGIQIVCWHFNHSIKFSQLLVGPTTKMNLFQSVTSALDNTLASDPTAGNKTGLDCNLMC